MESNTLIRKIHMDCPLCDKTHELEERKRNTTITIKGEKDSIIKLLEIEQRRYWHIIGQSDEKYGVGHEFEIKTNLNQKSERSFKNKRL